MPTTQRLGRHQSTIYDDQMIGMHQRASWNYYLIFPDLYCRTQPWKPGAVDVLRCVRFPAGFRTNGYFATNGTVLVDASEDIAYIFVPSFCFFECLFQIPM